MRDRQPAACLCLPQVLACQCLGEGAVEATLLGKMSDVMRKDVKAAVAEAPGRPEPQVQPLCKFESFWIAANTIIASIGEWAPQGTKHGLRLRAHMLAFLIIIVSSMYNVVPPFAALHAEGGGKASEGGGTAGACRHGRCCCRACPGRRSAAG